MASVKVKHATDYRVELVLDPKEAEVIRHLLDKCIGWQDFKDRTCIDLADISYQIEQSTCDLEKPFDGVRFEDVVDEALDFWNEYNGWTKK